MQHYKEILAELSADPAPPEVIVRAMDLRSRKAERIMAIRARLRVTMAKSSPAKRSRHVRRLAHGETFTVYLGVRPVRKLNRFPEVTFQGYVRFMRTMNQHKSDVLGSNPVAAAAYSKVIRDTAAAARWLYVRGIL